MRLFKTIIFAASTAVLGISVHSVAAPCNALEMRPHAAEINIGEPYTLLLNTTPIKTETGVPAPQSQLLYSLELDNNPVQINVRTEPGFGLYGIMMKPFTTPGVKRFRLFTFDARPPVPPLLNCDLREIVIATTSITVLAPTSATALAPAGLSGLWWNARTSGQGVFFNQNYPSNIAFVGWFTYDATGNAKWYVGDRCAVSTANTPSAESGTCTTQLFETKGATFDGTTFNGGALAVTPVGEATFTFANNQAATMRYTLRGVAGTIDLVRQPF